MNCPAVIIGKDNMKTAALVLAGNTLKEDNLENIYLEKDVYSNGAVGIFCQCRKKQACLDKILGRCPEIERTAELHTVCVLAFKNS